MDMAKMPEAQRFTTQRASRIVTEWSDSFADANAHTLLNDWKCQSFAYSFLSSLRDTGVHRDLLESFIREIEPFDCLLIAGWRPDENQLSDVIGSLFDSNWGHPFAGKILQHVLDALVANGSLSATRCENIKRTIQLSPTQIFVRRERRGDTSRADIDVYTSGSAALFVRIEHKIRGGAETFIGDKYQTTRLWTDAIKRAKQLHIETDNVICIFLTPGGEPAASRKFATLSFTEFADAVCAAITDPLGRSERLTRAAVSILGFMSYYRRA